MLNSSKCFYCKVVVGLVWSYDSESYINRSFATGRVSQAGQVKGGDVDNPGSGLLMRLTISHRKIKSCMKLCKES